MFILKKLLPPVLKQQILVAICFLPLDSNANYVFIKGIQVKTETIASKSTCSDDRERHSEEEQQQTAVVSSICCPLQSQSLQLQLASSEADDGSYVVTAEKQKKNGMYSDHLYTADIIIIIIIINIFLIYKLLTPLVD